MKTKSTRLRRNPRTGRLHDIGEELGLCPEAMALLILAEMRWFLRDPLTDFRWQETVEFTYKIYDRNKEFRQKFPRGPRESIGHLRMSLCHWLANDLAKQFPSRPLVLPFEFVWRGAGLEDFPRPEKWNGGEFPEADPNFFPVWDDVRRHLTERSRDNRMARLRERLLVQSYGASQ